MPDNVPGTNGHALNMARLVDEALEKHGRSDWYFALYCAALESTGAVRLAIEAANYAYEKCPRDPSVPAPDDTQAILFPPSQMPSAGAP